MAMSQSEYLRRITDNAPRLIARNKVRDSSEQTFIVQARGNRVTPSVVRGTTTVNGISTVTYADSVGNGTFNDYTAILQRAQSCAICSDPDPVRNQFIYISSICEDRTLAPYAQNTTVYYHEAGKMDYFPPKLSATCSTNQIQYPYPSG